MNISERAKAFVPSLRELSERTIGDWRRCPRCGGTDTCQYGAYTRNPWFRDGRRRVRVQRHRGNGCHTTSSERSPLLGRGSWYAREVPRAASAYWQFGGTSLRRVGALLCAPMNHQGRWLLWRPLDPEPAEECRLGARTVHRWLDGAGKTAAGAVAGQLEGVACSGEGGTDGLWAVLRGGATGVLLVLVDNVTGLIWPPVVVDREESEEQGGSSSSGRSGRAWTRTCCGGSRATGPAG